MKTLEYIAGKVTEHLTKGTTHPHYPRTLAVAKFGYNIYPGHTYALDGQLFRCVKINEYVGVFENIDEQGNAIHRKTGPHPNDPKVRRHIISRRLSELRPE